MKKSTSLTLIVLVFFLLVSNSSLRAQRNLEYYLEKATNNSPFLQNFVYQQEISSLEVQKIKNQFEKPQWTLTADYLLAPYFFNNGNVIAITSTPDANAFGYDSGVTNGGLYSGQVNVNYQLNTSRQSSPLIKQEALFQLGMKNQSLLFQADLKRQITADYINAYLILQQMDYTIEVKDQLIQQKEFAQKLADRGAIRITDLELLSLEIKNLDYQLNNFDIQYRMALQILNTDAGIVDTSFVRLSVVVIDTRMATEASVFLEQFRLDSLGAVNDQAVFETRYIPQVNVFANGGINAVDVNNIYRKMGVSAGIRFSWLFKDGGQQSLNAQQNEIKKMNAHDRSQFANDQIQNNRLNNALVLKKSQQSIQLLDSQLDGYQRLLQSYHKEFALGQLSVIEYLNVLKTYADLQQQKALLETQLLLIINEMNYWNN